MKIKLFIVVLCLFSYNALFSQEPSKTMEALSGRTGPVIFSIEDVDSVNIYGLMIDKEKINELFLKDGKAEIKLIYDAFSSSAYSLVCNVDKQVLVIFNNQELNKKIKKQNGLSSISQDKVNISFLDEDKGEKKYGKKGKMGAIIIETIK